MVELSNATLPAVVADDPEEGYIAGFIDGEGCISVSKRTGGKSGVRFQMSVRISNTNKEVLKWMQSIVGGSIYEHRSKDASRKTSYELCVLSDAAVNLLISIMPHIKVKKRQAELALMFQASFTHNSVLDFGFHNFIFNEMKLLNRRSCKNGTQQS